MLPEQTVQIIANPVAGGGRGATLARALEDCLRAGGYEVTRFETLKAGDARGEAARARAECVAVVGGDGTLNEVLNGLPEGTGARLAIVPAGTANVVARELGMRPDAARAARAIAGGNTISMDVGQANGRRFLLGAGAGLDAAVVRGVHEARGMRSSVLRWFGPGWRVVGAARFPGIAVEVDGEPLASEANYVVIGNCRYSAGIFPATPHARVDDGLLDICAFSGLTRARLAWLALNVWWPGYTDRPWIACRQGRVVALRPASEEPVDFQIDGDPAGILPARVELAGWSLRMVVPPPKA
ncbi:MAG: hypothetical protein KF886_13655 [Candidatus Hydrogenedentes bacterium]|nr:hypothetical protein [Candidatus Hydrogenedentota bacterium]